jgi:hypothetical protein
VEKHSQKFKNKSSRMRREKNQKHGHSKEFVLKSENWAEIRKKEIRAKSNRFRMNQVKKNKIRLNKYRTRRDHSKSRQALVVN